MNYPLARTKEQFMFYLAMIADEVNVEKIYFEDWEYTRNCQFHNPPKEERLIKIMSDDNPPDLGISVEEEVGTSEVIGG